MIPRGWPRFNNRLDIWIPSFPHALSYFLPGVMHFVSRLRVSMVKHIFCGNRSEESVMKVGQPAIESRPNIRQDHASMTSGRFIGRIGGGLNRLFGCWHSEMSRPFSSEGQSYRVCLSCGARRQFNIRKWETQGDFYYRLPTSKHFRALNGLAAR